MDFGTCRPARQRTKRAFDVGTEEGEPEPEPDSSRPATPSPAWPSPASLSSPLLSSRSPAANLNRNDQNPPLEGVSVAGPELWPSGDWSSARALPATHGCRRRARVSSALAKTCMRFRITPTGSGRVLQLSYLVPQTGLMSKTCCPWLNLTRSLKAGWTLLVLESELAVLWLHARGSRLLQGTCDSARQSKSHAPVPMMGGSGFAGRRSSLSCLQTLMYLSYLSVTNCTVLYTETRPSTNSLPQKLRRRMDYKTALRKSDGYRNS
jgi:hypothetical protein